MDNQFTQIIKKITDKYSSEIFKDPPTLKSLLADFSEGAFYKERNLFILFLENNCHESLTVNRDLDDWKTECIKKLYKADFIDKKSALYILDFILDTAAVFNYFFATGEVLLKTNDFNNAIVYFDKAIKCLPSSYDAYKCKGIALLKSKNYVKAINNFEYAIKLNQSIITQLTPFLYESYLNLGIYYQKKNMDKEAIDWFNIAVKYVSGDKEQEIGLLIKLAVSYANIEKPDNAVDCYSKVITIDENNIEAYKLRSNIYYKIGNYDKAFEDCKIISKIKEDDFETIYHVALIYSKLGNYFDAQKTIRGLLQQNISQELMVKSDKLNTLIDTELSNYYEKEGNSYFANKEYEKTIESFEKVLEYKKKDTIILKASISYFLLKNNESALMSFKRIIERFPDSTEAKIANGMASFISMDYENTIRYLTDKNIITSVYNELVNPVLIEAYINSGKFFMQTKRNKEAFALYTSANKLFPTQLDFIYGKGMSAYTINDIDTAIDCFLKIPNSDIIVKEKIQPHLAAAYLKRGDIYKENGNIKLAIADYEQSINIQTNNEIYMKRAKAYTLYRLETHIKRLHILFIQGKYEDLKHICNNILEIDPNNPKASYICNDIYDINSISKRESWENSMRYKATTIFPFKCANCKSFISNNSICKEMLKVHAFALTYENSHCQQYKKQFCK